MTNQENERFVRWQEVTREHFAFVNNLFITIGIAILGFIFSLVTNNEFKPECNRKLYFGLSVIGISVSIIFGIIGTVSRLYDYKYTTKKIRENNSVTAEKYKVLYRIYGNITWCTFKIQVASFIFGVLILSIGIILVYNSKLF